MSIQPIGRPLASWFLGLPGPHLDRSPLPSFLPPSPPFGKRRAPLAGWSPSRPRSSASSLRPGPVPAPSALPLSRRPRFWPVRGPGSLSPPRDSWRKPGPAREAAEDSLSPPPHVRFNGSPGTPPRCENEFMREHRGGPSEIATFCLLSLHRNCPHAWGGGVNLWSGRQTRVVCQCSCHDDCPLTSLARHRRKIIPAEVWATRCTCPAAQAAKERFSNSSAARPPILRRVSAILRLGVGLMRLYRTQGQPRAPDEAPPSVVVLNARSKAIADRAEELASSGDTSEQAV
jgi:hypothetical protein